MKERDRNRADRLDAALAAYADEVHPLPGIADAAARQIFLRQLIDSLHRVEYPRRLLARPMTPRRADPGDAEFFDPIRAAVYHRAQGDHDEACWLVFLFVMYGKSERQGWRLIRDVYRRLNHGSRWDWATVSTSPADFAQWVATHAETLQPRGAPRGFGNHRKFESIGATGRSVETYVAWIGPGGHQTKFDAASAVNGGDARRTFHALYRSMNAVYRFGRLGKFDYLTMLGKLDLARVEPGSTYMTGATGPVSGARLLFAGDPEAAWTPRRLDQQLADLDTHLGVGMQALEDALCNWQKSPVRFKRFRG